MTNSLHTPGPWQAGVMEKDGPWAVGNRHATAIAKMVGAPGGHNEANARLMAAAPEMLEALRMAEHLLANGNGRLLANEPTHLAVKAAIAKATGA